jgi:isopentenyl-diphosphate delta-isomerase
MMSSTNKIILVNKNDEVIGFESKEKCHHPKGILHRAFSVFIFNEKKELLIQKRSRLKRLWPLYWSNTCCSHPNKNESYRKAGERRLKEELGLTCNLKYLYKFRYMANYKNIGSENEICAVLIGKINNNTRITINPVEVSEFKWIPMKELIRSMIKNPYIYTPWFKIETKRLLFHYEKEINNLYKQKT